MKAIRHALEVGYTHIDTAEMYANGHTEELIGEAIKDYDRSELQITTKVWHTHLYYHGTRRAIEGCLGRLGTTYIDYFLIHGPARDMNLPETFKANKTVIVIDLDLIGRLECFVAASRKAPPA